LLVVVQGLAGVSCHRVNDAELIVDHGQGFGVIGGC
jgi:hypothetical protein